MSKFGGFDYLVCIQEHGSHHSKRIIKNSARVYANHYNIPLQRCFSNRQKDYHHFFTPEDFSPLRADCLTNVTINDKLFIVGHADENFVGPFNSHTFGGGLASMLRTCGLRQVGLVTFKACNVGTGNFLERFVVSAASAGIVIGWAKGYRGSAGTYDEDDDGNDIGRPRERIRRLVGGVKQVLRGNDRLKIVRGPLNPFVRSHGRYTVAQDDENFIFNMEY